MLEDKKEDNPKEKLTQILASIEKKEIIFDFDSFLRENHSKFLTEITKYKFKFSNENFSEEEDKRGKELKVVLSFLLDIIFIEKREINLDIGEFLISIIQFSTGIQQQEDEILGISAFLMIFAMIWLKENNQEENNYIDLLLLITRRIVKLDHALLIYPSNLIEENMKIFFTKVVKIEFNKIIEEIFRNYLKIMIFYPKNLNKSLILPFIDYLEKANESPSLKEFMNKKMKKILKIFYLNNDDFNRFSIIKDSIPAGEDYLRIFFFDNNQIKTMKENENLQFSKVFLNNLLKNDKICLAFLQNLKNYETLFQLNLQDNQKCIQLHILNYLSKDLFYLSNNRKYFLKIFLDNVKNVINNKNISSTLDGFQLFLIIKFFENILYQHISCEDNMICILNESSSLRNFNYTQLYLKEKLSGEAKELLIECGVFECIWALLEKKVDLVLPNFQNYLFQMVFSLQTNSLAFFQLFFHKITQINNNEDIFLPFIKQFWDFLKGKFLLEPKELIEMLTVIVKSAYYFKNSTYQNVLFSLIENLIRNFGNHGLFRYYLDFTSDFLFRREIKSEDQRFFFLESLIESLEFFLKTYEFQQDYYFNFIFVDSYLIMKIPYPSTNNYSISFDLSSFKIFDPIKNNESFQNIIEIKSSIDSLKIKIQSDKQLKMVIKTSKLSLNNKIRRKKKDPYSEVGGFAIQNKPKITLVITITRDNQIECSHDNKRFSLIDFCFSSEIEIIIGDKTRESTLLFNEITNLKVPTYNFKQESIPEGAYVDKEYIFLENAANPLIIKNFAFRKRSILFQPKHLFKRITSWFYVLLQNKFFSEKNSNYLLSRILNLITTDLWSFIEEKHKRFFVKIFELNANLLTSISPLLTTAIWYFFENKDYIDIRTKIIFLMQEVDTNESLDVNLEDNFKKIKMSDRNFEKEIKKILLNITSRNLKSAIFIIEKCKFFDEKQLFKMLQRTVMIEECNMELKDLLIYKLCEFLLKNIDNNKTKEDQINQIDKILLSTILGPKTLNFFWEQWKAIKSKFFFKLIIKNIEIYYENQPKIFNLFDSQEINSNQKDLLTVFENLIELLQTENILFSTMNNDNTGYFYLFNDCIEKLIAFLNIGLPIERILVVSQQLLFSHTNKIPINFVQKYEINMRNIYENQDQINYLLNTKKSYQNQYFFKLPPNQYLFIGIHFYFIIFGKINEKEMETENFANFLLIFKFLLKNFKLLDNYLKLLEQDLEIKDVFSVLFEEIEATDTSKLKTKILSFNLEQKIAKMRLFFQRNFLNQYAEENPSQHIDQAFSIQDQLCLLIDEYNAKRKMFNYYKRYIFSSDHMEKKIFQRSLSKHDNLGLPIYRFKSYSHELKNLKKKFLNFFEFKSKFSDLFNENNNKDGLYCEYITLIGAYRGIIRSTNRHIIFLSCIEMNKKSAEYKYCVPENFLINKENTIVIIEISHIVKAHTKNLFFIDNSLEMRLKSGKTFFFNFFQKKDRDRFVKNNHLDPEQNLSKITEKWCKNKLKNFQYLLAINEYSGRSFAFSSYYPVFPWIVSNYDSKELNLSNKNNNNIENNNKGRTEVFRNLMTPIGVQTKKNKDECLIRWRECNYGNVEKFHHGTLYSSYGHVLYFLVRVEPFTKLNKDLQGGKIDVPDRLFNSLEITWQNDVKECIPEMFYLPLMFININNEIFGYKQNGLSVDNVVLPPWASCAEELVLRNKEALESEYVTRLLNNWIDLIFGYKQEGKAAEDNLNVYYFLTTATKAQIEKRPENQLEPLISQMFYYGICPKQLFFDPHKTKKINKEHKRSIIRKHDAKIDYKNFKFIFCCENSDKDHDFELYALSTTGIIWKVFPDEDYIFQIEERPISNLKKTEFSFFMFDRSKFLAFAVNSKLILYELGKQKYCSNYHKEKISFIVNFENFLLCASAENVISIWEINKNELRLKKLLMEHENKIIHLSKIEELQLAFSADELGLCLIINLKNFKIIQKIDLISNDEILKEKILFVRPHVNYEILVLTSSNKLKVFSFSGYLYRAKNILDLNTVDKVDYLFESQERIFLFDKFSQKPFQVINTFGDSDSKKEELERSFENDINKLIDYNFFFKYNKIIKVMWTEESFYVISD